MPFALVIIGLALLISGVKNTQDQLFTLVKGDFTGDKNFIFWVVSILIIGAIGYVPKLKPIANSFLVLVVVVLFLSNRGFFTQFNYQIGVTQVDPTLPSTPAVNNLQPVPMPANPVYPGAPKLSIF